MYYKLLNSENIITIETYLAILDMLILIDRTYDTPIYDISFTGISFVSSYKTLIIIILI